MEKTGILLQARLGSTRLPGKALKPLAGIPSVAHAMRALNLLAADVRVLVTDYASFKELAPVAEAEGFEIFRGPCDDVLRRYRLAADVFGLDTVIRATGDNPLVDPDAAALLAELHAESGDDYSALDGPPLGTGVEILRAEALRSADSSAVEAYDREHVSPYLYRNPSRFRVNRYAAPAEICMPGASVTMDTEADYDYLEQLFGSLYTGKPLHIKEIIPWLTRNGEADMKAASLLLSPSVERGNGTGHLRRCLKLASRFRAAGVGRVALFTDCEGNAPVFREDEIRLLDGASGASGLEILTEVVPSDWTACVFDRRRTPVDTVRHFSGLTRIIGLDEGGAARAAFDYLIDSLPNMEAVFPNIYSTAFLELPAGRRKRASGSKAFSKVLISFGGEDRAHLTETLLDYIEDTGILGNIAVTVVKGPLFGDRTFPGNPEVLEAPEALGSFIGEWDLVFTSFGITCFEALSTGVPVVLFNPGKYHQALAVKAGIPEIGIGKPDIGKLERLLGNPERLERAVENYSRVEPVDLSRYIITLCGADRNICPGCGRKHPYAVLRRPERSFFKCRNCGLIHELYFAENRTVYNGDYFFEEYRKQYGRTYLEDFDNIKRTGNGRLAVIKRMINNGRLLDIGCGYGPFLAAAVDAGFEAEGMDVSADAVSWVNENLGIPARICGAEALEGRWDVITMWYVIEHLQDAGGILRRVSASLPSGGVFAFSTPNYNGISRKKSAPAFLDSSPADHLTIWSPVSARKLLRKYGMRVRYCRSATCHPERFWKDQGVYNRLPVPLRKAADAAAVLACRIFRLGDTFEVYAEKI